MPTTTILDCARARAIFVSPLQPSNQITREDTDLAIRTAAIRYGNDRCTCDVADEFGEHPDRAAARMRWALRVVAELYPHTPPPVTHLVVHQVVLIGAPDR